MDGSPLPRCNSKNYYSASSASRTRCPADMVVDPTNAYDIIQNSELRKASEYAEAVQVKPQHVSLRLRISRLTLLAFLDKAFRDIATFFGLIRTFYRLLFYYFLGCIFFDFFRMYLFFAWLFNNISQVYSENINLKTFLTLNSLQMRLMIWIFTMSKPKITPWICIT